MTISTPMAPMKALPDYSNKRFLIVDDKPFIRGLIQGMLLRCKARDIKFAADGDEAIRVLAAENGDIDCIICDWNMEPVDGLELARLLRLGAVPNTPRDKRFIMLTGHAEMELVKSAMDLDVSGFLVKPVSMEKLVKALENAFAKSVSIKDHQEYMNVGGVSLPGTITSPVQKATPWIFKSRVDVDQADTVAHIEQIRREAADQTNSAGMRRSIINKTREELDDIPAGKVLAQNIFSADGRLLLSTGVVLTVSLLDRLRELSQAADHAATLLVGDDEHSAAA